MAEYIEREALKDHLMSYAGMFTDELGFAVSLQAVLNGIDFQPAADVAPVVRCRNCLYWQDNNGGYPHEECRWGKDETPDPDDYCSFGELKEGT